LGNQWMRVDMTSLPVEVIDRSRHVSMCMTLFPCPVPTAFLLLLLIADVLNAGVLTFNRSCSPMATRIVIR